jgi:hypothetical protein
LDVDFIASSGLNDPGEYATLAKLTRRKVAVVLPALQPNSTDKAAGRREALDAAQGAKSGTVPFSGRAALPSAWHLRCGVASQGGGQTDWKRPPQAALPLLVPFVCLSVSSPFFSLVVWLLCLVITCL